MPRRTLLFGLLLLGVFLAGATCWLGTSQAAAPGAGSERSAGGGTTPSATATPNPCGLAWRIVPSANSGTSTNALAAVAVAGPDDIWAAGYYNNTSAQADQTLIEHWTGSTWTIVLSPNVGTNSNTLAGLAAVSPSDLWAVGTFFNTSSGHLETLTEHWNGTAWSVVASPNVAGSDTLLNAVTAVSSNDVWAVGFAASGFEQHPSRPRVPTASQTVILHWDGTAWSQVGSPNPGGDSITLTWVSAVASNNVFAVGSYLDTTVFQFKTLALRWNGSTWTIVFSANSGSDDSYLTAVSMLTGTLGWAVGYYHDATTNTNYSLTERWDGEAWNIVPSPLAGIPTGNQLFGVVAIAASDVWAVGNNTDANGIFTTLTEHWDGSAWTIVPSPSNGPDYDTLQAVAAVTGTDVWAVGYYDLGNVTDNTLVERYHDPCGAPSATPTNTALPTSTATSSATNTALPTSTATGTRTSTPTASGTATGTATAAPSSATATQTATSPATHTTTLTPSSTPAQTAVPTSTGTVVPPSATALRSATAVPSSATPVPPSPTATAVCDFHFGDVQNDFWAFGYIWWAYCHGIVNGYADNTFRPEADTIRGEIAKMVALAARFPLVLPPGAPHFSDVPPGSPFYLYVEVDYAHYVVSGYAGGTFRPFDRVTRAQLAKMLVQARGLALANPPQRVFVDVPATYWAVQYVETAYVHQIVSGYDCGGAGEPCPGLYFRPDTYATRAQLTRMIFQAFAVPSQ